LLAFLEWVKAISPFVDGGGGGVGFAFGFGAGCYDIAPRAVDFDEVEGEL